MSSVSYRSAMPSDQPALRAFLESAGLPTEDVSTERQDFLLAREGDQIVGSVALERVGSDALIRSLAVVPERRGQGIGATLTERAIETARKRGLRALYLLTTTAREYSLRRGFEVIDRRAVPAGILALPQFRSLCPATATCLRMRIGDRASAASGREIENHDPDTVQRLARLVDLPCGALDSYDDESLCRVCVEPAVDAVRGRPMAARLEAAKALTSGQQALLGLWVIYGHAKDGWSGLLSELSHLTGHREFWQGLASSAEHLGFAELGDAIAAAQRSLLSVPADGGALRQLDARLARLLPEAVKTAAAFIRSHPNDFIRGR